MTDLEEFPHKIKNKSVGGRLNIKYLKLWDAVTLKVIRLMKTLSCTSLTCANARAVSKQDRVYILATPTRPRCCAAFLRSKLGRYKPLQTDQ